MAFTKLAPHILVEPPIDETREVLSRWQPPVIKSLGDMGYLPLVADVVPEAKLIQRFYWSHAAGDPGGFDTWFATYQGNTLETWLGMFHGAFASQQGNGRMYVESFNEVGMGEAYLRFEADRVNTLYNRYGLRSCVINAAVGTTSAFDWQIAQNVGLLDAIRNTGSIIGLHAYAGLFMSLWHGRQNLGNPANENRLYDDPRNLIFRPVISYEDPDGLESWLAFRCRRDHEDLRSLGFGDLKMVITEFGLDNAGIETYRHYTNNESRGGFRSWINDWQRLGFLEGTTPEDFYVDQLLWADQQLQAYPFIEAATIFTYHSDPITRKWYDYDIRGPVMETLFRRWFGGDIATAPTQEPDIQITPSPTIPPGPGPIHSTPEFHFMVLGSPQINQWFYETEAARRYWETFLPSVMMDYEVIHFLPNQTSLMVTLITTPDMRPAIEDSILQRWQYVGMDVVEVNSAMQLAEILASRVAANRRFG